MLHIINREKGCYCSATTVCSVCEQFIAHFSHAYFPNRVGRISSRGYKESIISVSLNP